MSFPKEFVWGAATASYQIEGAANIDGKGPSVWDMMCRWEGKIYEGQSGEVACDHYHRYKEDVALMKQIGLQAYRLSISWPRVIPQGTGTVNAAGLDFYDHLVDALLAAGIEPYVTLFHWDYPLALFYRGGWLNRESVEWFGQYTEVLADRLGDRVKNWITLNEPQCFIGLGHESGTHAPGLKLPVAEQLLAAHHALMAHGRAVQVLRSRCKVSPRIGFAPVGLVSYPAGNDPANIEVARKATFSITEKGFWNNTWFGDPAVLGHYPEDGLELFGSEAPRLQSGDMELIAQPLDFYGANIYNALPVKPDGDGGIQIEKRYDGFPVTLMHWPVEPDSLYWGPKFLQERYKLPILITENGLSNPDWVSTNGKVNDPQRIDFIKRYLRRLRDAIEDGVDVQGYFHWSLMDNFEWAAGYKQRFGMVHVDYPTGKRTLKDSALWYAKVIESRGDSLNN